MLSLPLTFEGIGTFECYQSGLAEKYPKEQQEGRFQKDLFPPKNIQVKYMVTKKQKGIISIFFFLKEVE